MRRKARCRWASPPIEWSYGDRRRGLQECRSGARRNLHHAQYQPSVSGNPHRDGYWQNGKVFVHTGTQSTAQTVPAIARWLNIDPANVVLISEYTGGGFGSKITGAISSDHPGAFSRRSPARPVMMRISREEEHYIGRGAPQPARPHEGRLHERRKDHRARHVRDPGQRSVRSERRCRLIGPHRVAVVPAARHALAGNHGPDQYAAANFAERARAVCRASRSWSRSCPRRRASWASIRWLCGASTRLKARRKFGPEVRGQAQLCHQRLHQGSARHGRGAVQVGRAKRRSLSVPARKCAASAYR